MLLVISIYFSNIRINEKYINITQDKNYLILAYQNKRILNETQAETIFLGDSSLGNTINEELVTNLSRKKTKNFALNEIYGLSGQYNLLKKVLRNNKNLKDVYLFTSIYFVNSNNDSEAFFLTSENFLDFFKAYNKVDFITYQFKYLIKFIISKSEYDIIKYNEFVKDNIENNYIKQNISQNLKVPEQKKMNLEEKKYYLKLIEKLCKKNKIKLKLIKGPIFNQTYAKSNIFISNYEKLFNNNNLYKEQIFMNSEEIGDQIMHPAPHHKNNLSIKYFNLIKNE